MPISNCSYRWGCASVRGSLEYLYWETKGSDLPPLITTSPDGTDQESAGVLGEPTTDILFGSERVNDSGQSGIAASLQFWDACQSSALEFRYMGLEEERALFAAESQGDPILARPFVNVQNGANDAQLIAFTDLAEGAISANVSTQFESAEVYVRRAMVRDEMKMIDWLFGYRLCGAGRPCIDRAPKSGYWRRRARFSNRRT